MGWTAHAERHRVPKVVVVVRPPCKLSTKRILQVHGVDARNVVIRRRLQLSEIAAFPELTHPISVFVLKKGPGAMVLVTCRARKTATLFSSLSQRVPRDGSGLRDAGRASRSQCG
jgi:hypothetical protein